MTKLDEDYVPTVNVLRSVCAGLVTIDEESGIIRLVHYTTHEYFERTKLEWFPNANENITINCITYLSFSTFENGFCTTDEEFEKRLQQNPLYDYAARNWGYHALAASIKREQLILDFLESGAKVSSSSQALMASRSYECYSQMVPRQMRGVHLAAIFGLEKIMITLLEKGNNPHPKDTYSRTPLSYTAECGHEAVVKALLEKGADMESKDNYMRTPLSWAAGRGQEAVVKLLLERGADLKSKDKNGLTPLSWAAERGTRSSSRRCSTRAVT